MTHIFFFLSHVYLLNKSCGACGACSNWNDIQLQYTTRKVLAAISTVWYDYYDAIDSILFWGLFFFLLLHLFHSYMPVHAIILAQFNSLWYITVYFYYAVAVAVVFSTKKSIGKKFNSSDDNDSVVQCHHLQLGFTIPCAKAWAWDTQHTKHAVSTG